MSDYFLADDLSGALDAAAAFHHAGRRVMVTGAYYTAPAVVAADGRVAFLSEDGISMLDPRDLPFNRLPAPVHIEQLTADRKTYDALSAGVSSLRLPA